MTARQRKEIIQDTQRIIRFVEATCNMKGSDLHTALVMAVEEARKIKPEPEKV